MMARMKGSSVSKNTTCTTDSSSYHNDGSRDELTVAPWESSSRIVSVPAAPSMTMTAIVAAVASAKNKTVYTRSMTWWLKKL
jgi:hypothetical protein